ncbi:hypothetical protein [uncultured Lacinutrix sp.]|uniref:hypothetical protein n=1 Tax=uncultured Lacinutrix sp. TaxID=574032 RepID=UPI002635B060|nr:hypothetical protein [uncultured Lacinutrix sp.]
MTATHNDIKKICFFCSQPIEGKKTLEHIIPNSLLGKLGIKEEELKGEGAFQYSRIKVPAHSSCNSGFGSEYENKIIELLDNPKQLYVDLKNEESGISMRYGPDESFTMLISTWLSKIYYGLFYNDYLKLGESEFTKSAKNIIESDNFKMVQEAYQDGVGFCIPSSLYVFTSKNESFDLRTMIYPQTILMKVKSLTMILCIGDGFLTKNYLNNGILKDYRDFLALEEKKEQRFPVHLYGLAEITSLRMHIPKEPSFIYSKQEKVIINMSLTTGVSDPDEYYKVDEVSIIKKRDEILKEFGVIIE